MKRVIHEIDEMNRRIYFIHPVGVNALANAQSHFSVTQKKMAKYSHKAMLRNEQRQSI